MALRHTLIAWCVLAPLAAASQRIAAGSSDLGAYEIVLDSTTTYAGFGGEERTRKHYTVTYAELDMPFQLLHGGLTTDNYRIGPVLYVLTPKGHLKLDPIPESRLEDSARWIRRWSVSRSGAGLCPKHARRPRSPRPGRAC